MYATRWVHSTQATADSSHVFVWSAIHFYLKMNSLPSELYDHILRQLDLNDLARCSRVSRRLRESVHRVLSTITSVHNRDDYFIRTYNLYRHLTLALSKSDPEQIVSHAKVRYSRTGSFLRFVTIYCPRVSSLVATSLKVQLEDISALAPRLTFFSLSDITSAGTSIDAKSLATNFPNVQLYILHQQHLCPYEVMLEYSRIPSNQFAKYLEVCTIHQTCEKTVDVRSMESPQFITIRSPLDLHQLRPSSLSSLRYLNLRRLTSVGEHPPPLPNLLDVTIYCYLVLKDVIRLLLNSPKLFAANLNCKIDNQSVSAVQLLLSKCRDLQVFTLRRYDDYIDDANDKRSLDLSQARSLKDFNLWRIKVPVNVILPSQCQKIEINCDTVYFSIDGGSFNFFKSSVLFNEMSAFAHPVEIRLDKPSEELIDRIIHLSPQVSRLALKLDTDDETTHLPNVFEKMLAKTDVSDIMLIDEEGKDLDEPLLFEFFSLINEYPERFFSITIDGFVKTPLKQLMETVITRPFIIDDESDANLHMVEFPAAGNVLPSANSQLSD